METVVIILSILLFICVGIIIATKLGKFSDKDQDGIPDLIESKFEELKGKIDEITKK